MRKVSNSSYNLLQKEVDDINCLSGRRQKVDDIREHLLYDGIKRNYTTWIWHGEMIDMQNGF